MDGRARGIDVSHHNEVVDWSQAAAAGISFAFAKASQGMSSGADDAMFPTNWQKIKDAGLIRGAYHFVGLPSPTTPQAQWNDDIHRQVDHFLGRVNAQPGDLPPVLDFEDGDSPARWKALITSNRAGALSIVREFITYTTSQLNGASPIIYTGSFWSSELGDPDPHTDNMPFSDSSLWIAQYPIGLHTPVPLPPPPPGKTDEGEARDFNEYAAKLDSHQPRHIPIVWGGVTSTKWKFWQFSEYGRIPSLTGSHLDLDVFNGSVQDLQGLCLS